MNQEPKQGAYNGENLSGGKLSDCQCREGNSAVEKSRFGVGIAL